MKKKGIILCAILVISQLCIVVAAEATPITASIETDRESLFLGETTLCRVTINTREDELFSFPNALELDSEDPIEITPLKPLARIGSSYQATFILRSFYLGTMRVSLNPFILKEIKGESIPVAAESITIKIKRSSDIHEQTTLQDIYPVLGLQASSKQMNAPRWVVFSILLGIVSLFLIGLVHILARTRKKKKESRITQEKNFISLAILPNTKDELCFVCDHVKKLVIETVQEKYESCIKNKTTAEIIEWINATTIEQEEKVTIVTLLRNCNRFRYAREMPTNEMYSTFIRDVRIYTGEEAIEC